MMDEKTVRANVADKVNRIFAAVPVKHAETVVSRQKHPGSESYFIMFCNKGSRYLNPLSKTHSLEDVLEIVDKSHPRFIDALNRVAPELGEPIEFERISEGTHPLACAEVLKSPDAVNLMSNLLTKGESSLTMDTGKVLANILLAPELGGLTEFLRYTGQERIDALCSLKVPDDRIASTSSILVGLLAQGNAVIGVRNAMHRKQMELVDERTQAGFTKSRSSEYWTLDRIRQHDPSEFWDPDRLTLVDPSHFMTTRAELTRDWSGLSETERELYKDFLPGTGRRLVAGQMEMQSLIYEVIDEFGFNAQRNEEMRIFHSFLTSVNADGEKFSEWIETAKTQNNKVLDVIELGERWGIGRPEVRLLQGAKDVITTSPGNIPPIENAADHLQSIERPLAMLNQYHMCEFSLHRGFNQFADTLLELDPANHELAVTVWKGFRPEALPAEQTALWPVHLLVTTDFKHESIPDAEMEYPRHTQKLLKDNVGKPYIAEFAYGFLNPERPQDLEVFHRYLSQEYMDEHLDKMQPEVAKSVCIASRQEASRRFLTPGNHDGDKVLKLAVEKPSLFNPIMLITHNPVRQEFIPLYLACLSDDTDRQRLEQVNGKSYQAVYGSLFAVRTAREREQISTPDFIGLLDSLSQPITRNVNAYLSMLAMDDDRQALLSPVVQSLLRENPDNAGYILTLQSNRRMGQIRDLITQPGNSAFFNQQLGDLASKASDDSQWMMAAAALKHLEGG